MVGQIDADFMAEVHRAAHQSAALLVVRLAVHFDRIDHAEPQAHFFSGGGVRHVGADQETLGDHHVDRAGEQGRFGPVDQLRFAVNVWALARHRDVPGLHIGFEADQGDGVKLSVTGHVGRSRSGVGVVVSVDGFGEATTRRLPGRGALGRLDRVLNRRDDVEVDQKILLFKVFEVEPAGFGVARSTAVVAAGAGHAQAAVLQHVALHAQGTGGRRGFGRSPVRRLFFEHLSGDGVGEGSTRGADRGVTFPIDASGDRVERLRFVETGFDHVRIIGIGFQIVGIFFVPVRRFGMKQLSFVAVFGHVAQK